MAIKRKSKLLLLPAVAAIIVFLILALPIVPHNAFSYSFSDSMKFNNQLWNYGASYQQNFGVQSSPTGSEVSVNHNPANGIAPVTARPIYNIHWEAAHPDGTIYAKGDTHNTVTNLGIGIMMNNTFTSSVNTNYHFYVIALSTNTTAPVTTWVSVPNEITGSGLDRATTTPTYNSNANITISHQWTANATYSGIASAFLCWNATAGAANDVFSGFLLNPTVNMGSGDTLTVSITNTGTGT